MLSDFQLATLVSSAYGFGPALTWDNQNDGTDAAGVRWFVHVLGGIVYVVFPGTETPRDLFRDVDAIPEHTEIGSVHAGFNKGMAATLDAVFALAKARPLVVAGHSLGASRATLFTAFCVQHGVRPLRRTVFGEPLSCFAMGAALARQIPGVSYWARDKILCDPIPMLPPAIGYTRATDPRALRVTISKAAQDDLGPLAIHSILGYAAALDTTTA